MQIINLYKKKKNKKNRRVSKHARERVLKD